MATRGICPTKIINNQQWWHGPAWLTDPPPLWPINNQKSTIDSSKLEERKIINHVTIEPEWDLLSRYSKFTQLIGIIALCKRFINNLKQSSTKITEFLSSHELKTALQSLIIYTQGVHFTNTIRCIKNSSHQHANNNLTSLNPFIDNNGILRVGGRIEHANTPYDQRHPIILPRHSHLSTRIVDYIHHQTLHGNVQLMLNVIRLRYWIINARSIVKRCIHNCVTCVRIQAKIEHPFMANLPANRINPSHPFMHTAMRDQL